MKITKEQAQAALAGFWIYCVARQNGNKDVEDAMLDMLRKHGMKVEDRDGRWCLMQANGEEFPKEPPKT